MTVATATLLIILMLIFSAMFSGVEIAFITSDRVRTELDVKRGGIVSGIVNMFYRRSSFFISTILVGNNIALVIYGLAAADLLDPILDNQFNNKAVTLLLSTIATTIVILLFGEFIPKTLFRINPNSSLRLFAIPIYVIYLILWPISQLSTWISRLLMRMFGIKDTSTSLLGYLTQGDLNNFLEREMEQAQEDDNPETIENEVKIFHNALDFSSIHLRDCMIPRNEMVAVDIDDTTDSELIEMFTSSGRSKILVYREDIDNILGYIHVSELFDATKPWREHIKDVIFAPDTLLANKMMGRLLSEKRSIAVVIDEFGGTAGMVTLEDLVEEIFGDIQDEHDHTKLTQRRIDDHTFEFSGRLEIEYLNDTYRLDIPEDDAYQTLAGYILNATGSIPLQGNTIKLGDLSFTIVKRTSNRLELIRVSEEADKEAKAE